MDTDDFITALARRLNDDDNRPKISYEGEVECLRDAFAQFNERHVFKPGDLVRQKPQASIYKTISDNGVSVVVEMLPEPIILPSEPGTAHYREPNDMIIGERKSTGEFLLYHVDSRRFEPAPERRS